MPTELGRRLRPILDLIGPFLGLAAVIGVFCWLTGRPDKYLELQNLKTIAIQSAIVGTCGIGMTLVIIGGGIDLSVGSSLALSAVTVALVFQGSFIQNVRETIFRGHAGLPWIAAIGVTLAIGLMVHRHTRRFAPAAAWIVGLWFVGWLLLAGGPIDAVGERYLAFDLLGHGLTAVLAGALMGTLCGMLNAVLITSTRVVPFIITLGTMEIFRGAAQLIAKGESVEVDPRQLDQTAWLDNLMSSNPPVRWLFIGPGVWIMILMGILTMLLLSKTRLGRYIFAIGSNEEAARLSGVDVPAVKLWVYSLAGLLTGLAGVMQFSRFSYGSSTAGTGLELDVIAAVVIGGGSLAGGEGSVLGTFIGAAIMGFMRNGCTLAGIPNPVQRVLVGAIIVLAVALDQQRRRRRP